VFIRNISYLIACSINDANALEQWRKSIRTVQAGPESAPFRTRERWFRNFCRVSLKPAGSLFIELARAKNFDSNGHPEYSDENDR